MSGARAAVDCGTNSTRLLVVDDEGRSLVRLMRITRLGQGVDETGALAEEAIARTVDVLRNFRQQMDQFDVSAVRMVATSAVRDASNGATFVEQATAALGAAPEVLSGQEEGELAYAGANSDLARFDGETLVVDIGGGSTELILGVGATVQAISLQLGCVRISERYFTSDPATPSQLAAARQAIDDELSRGQAAIPRLAATPAARRMIGLAGTVSTLTQLHLGVAEFDREVIHHASVPLVAVQAMCTELAGLSPAERSGLIGMVKGREDVILGGALVLEAALLRFACGEVMASESDILDGIAASLRGV
jgi:exopolyphosphatase/guanosine-5'-triphosphate,3'-diphosphate pyrophosphatase